MYLSHGRAVHCQSVHCQRSTTTVPTLLLAEGCSHCWACAAWQVSPAQFTSLPAGTYVQLVRTTPTSLRQRGSDGLAGSAASSAGSG
jgi:hypothetical protein